MAYGRSQAMQALADRLMQIPMAAREHEYRMGQLGIQRAGIENALEQQKWQRGMEEKRFNLQEPGLRLQADIAKTQMEPMNFNQYLQFPGDIDNKTKGIQTFMDVVPSVFGKDAKFNPDSGTITLPDGRVVTRVEHDMKYAEPIAHMFGGVMDEKEFLEGIPANEMTPEQKARLAAINKDPESYYTDATEKAMSHLAELERTGLKREHLKGIIDKINWYAKNVESYRTSATEAAKDAGRNLRAALDREAKITAAGITAQGGINKLFIQGEISALNEQEKQITKTLLDGYKINEFGGKTPLTKEDRTGLMEALNKVRQQRKNLLKPSSAEPPPQKPAPTLPHLIATYKELAGNPDPTYAPFAAKVRSMIEAIPGGAEMLGTTAQQPATAVTPTTGGAARRVEREIPQAGFLPTPTKGGEWQKSFAEPPSGFTPEMMTGIPEMPSISVPSLLRERSTQMPAGFGTKGGEWSGAISIKPGQAPTGWAMKPKDVPQPKPGTTQAELAEQWAGYPIEEIIGDIRAVMGGLKSFGPELDALIEQTYQQNLYDAPNTAYALMTTLGLAK